MEFEDGVRQTVSTEIYERSSQLSADNRKNAISEIQVIPPNILSNYRIYSKSKFLSNITLTASLHTSIDRIPQFIDRSPMI